MNLNLCNYGGTYVLALSLMFSYWFPLFKEKSSPALTPFCSFGRLALNLKNKEALRAGTS